MQSTKGRAIDIVYEPSNFKNCYFDDHTGGVLPMELVQAAMMDELKYFSEITV